jgi:hypothetical protein
MKQSLLFMGLVVTFLVILFVHNVSKSFFKSHSVQTQESARIVMVCSLPDSALPTESSNEEDFYFKATPSFHSQTSVSVIRFHQEILCSFKSFTQSSHVELFRLPNPPATHVFFVILFRVIISTNAP